MKMVYKRRKCMPLAISEKNKSNSSLGKHTLVNSKKNLQIQHSNSSLSIKNKTQHLQKLSKKVKNISCRDSGIDSPYKHASSSSFSRERKYNETFTNAKNESDSQFIYADNFPVCDKTDAALFEGDSDCSSDPEITFNFARSKRYLKNLAPLPSDALAFESALGLPEGNMDCEKYFGASHDFVTSTPEKKFFVSKMEKVEDIEITLYESPEKVSQIKKYCDSPLSVSSDSCYWEEMELSSDNGAIVIHDLPLKEIEETVKKSKKTYNLKGIDESLKKPCKTYHSPHQFRRYLFKNRKNPKSRCVSEKKSKAHAEVKLDKWASSMNDHFKEIEASDLCIE